MYLVCHNTDNCIKANIEGRSNGPNCENKRFDKKSPNIVLKLFCINEISIRLLAQVI